MWYRESSYSSEWCTTKRPSEMAELIENPTRGSDPRERDSTPRNLQCMAKAPWGSEGWGGCLDIPEKRARLAGRLPNGVTLSALIMKVDAGCGCCFAIPRVPGTFFLRASLESFEFPDLRDTLPEIAKLGWTLRGFCRPATGYLRKRSDDSVTPVHRLISCSSERSAQHQFYWRERLWKKLRR